MDDKDDMDEYWIMIFILYKQEGRLQKKKNDLNKTLITEVKIISFIHFYLSLSMIKNQGQLDKINY